MITIAGSVFPGPMCGVRKDPNLAGAIGPLVPLLDTRGNHYHKVDITGQSQQIVIIGDLNPNHGKGHLECPSPQPEGVVLEDLEHQPRTLEQPILLEI